MTEEQIIDAGDPSAPARHVAVIMDGNSRWARRRGLPQAAGHRAGARNIRAIAEAASEIGLQYLTLFAFSTENWRRPGAEVRLLLDLLRRMLRNDVEELHRNDVRLQVVGDRSRFSVEIRTLMEQAERRTQDNRGLTLMMATNFGGRWDIADAARRIAQAARDGVLDPDTVDEAVFTRYLSLADVPEPDLCIRTGGDQRLSNFLLWDLAYAELYFTETFWPDFGAAELRRAVAALADRCRRFGGR